MRKVSLILLGFGNVGQAVARLILRKSLALEDQFQVRVKVNGIATGRHGRAVDPRGLDLEAALNLAQQGKSLDALSYQKAPLDNCEFIRTCPADAVFETTPVNHQTGQPAIDHLRAALVSGKHAVTANKGPVVHGFQELNNLAQQNGLRFLYESTVMDGAPIFSLIRAALPGAEVRGFHGILNSCTNLILERMESGDDFESAVDYAQQIGIAETDPTADVDGWDAAIKVAALSTAVLGVPLTPQQVRREGIGGISTQMMQAALDDGERWKLVCRATRTPDGVDASVQPQRVGPRSPLYSVNGTSSYVEFETDVLPGLGVLENDPSPETTAYGMLADLLNILRGV